MTDSPFDFGYSQEPSNPKPSEHPNENPPSPQDSSQQEASQQESTQYDSSSWQSNSPVPASSSGGFHSPLQSNSTEAHSTQTNPVDPLQHAGEASLAQTPPTETTQPQVGQAETAQPPVSNKQTTVKNMFDTITNEIHKIFVGQDELVLGCLVALFSGGHVLIESVPGLGKTLFVRCLGKVLGCEFGRIQFTADLMPSDITGAPVFDMKEQEFSFRPGPVFTQLLLADEINRSPAKTHAALLEIMQEYRVTVEGTSHLLERPFIVLATQNPVESEGTYNLPEAQLDRFMFKMHVEYPGEAEEATILTMHTQQEDLYQRMETEVRQITTPEQILKVMQVCTHVRIDPKLIEYINKIVRLTRQWPQFYLGASPRAGIALLQGARTLAAFYGRDYAVPDDVMSILLPALRHRVILTPEAEVEGREVDELLLELTRSVEVPRL